MDTNADGLTFVGLNMTAWNKGLRKEELMIYYKNGFAKPRLGKKNTSEANEKNRQSHLGDKNAMWKGDNLKYIDSARMRARNWFKEKQLCIICGKHGEIHHKDGNPLNNTGGNIDWLCRKHHMEIDGRNLSVLKNLKQFSEETLCWS
jgi:hypothetical protein